jgi:hypothetical protein
MMQIRKMCKQKEMFRKEKKRKENYQKKREP